MRRCAFCRCPPARIADQTWTVKGFSEVFVPSPGHESVPYFVSLLENRRGQRRFRKTFERPVLGQTVDLSPESGHQRESLVAMSRVGYSAVEAVGRCLDAIGGETLDRSTRVLLKPNLGFEMPASTGVVTNPRVTEAVIEYVLSHGVSAANVSVGDGAAIGFNTMRAASKSGTEEVCKLYGLRFLDFNLSQYVERKAQDLEDSMIYSIAREVFEHDLIINLPVVKTHFQVGISCSLKNMKGVVAAETRKRMHRRDIHMAIAELNSILPPYLTVADGTIGLEGMGPSVLGTPAHFGVIFASRDPVALDASICRLFHWPIPRYVLLSSQMRVGTDDASKIDLVGEEIKIVEGQRQLPDKEFSPHPSVSVIDGAGCSGCSNVIWLALQDLRKQVDCSDTSVSVLFGAGGADEARTTPHPLVCVGACALHLSGRSVDVVNGCPPKKEDITGVLRRRLDSLRKELRATA
jgi:uncharacterized protein (DUF362 family)